MKKINFNIIYYFCLGIFILSGLFRTMQQIFDPLEILAYALLIIKIITDNLGEYGKRKKKRTFREFFKEQL